MFLVLTVAFGSDRGFNSNIEWSNNLETAKAAQNVDGKPIFLLIHKSWCGACKRLKNVFVESKEIEHLSKSFHMVNLEDNEEPADDTYKPDGGYIPRILFIKDKELQVQIVNSAGNPKYKYFYNTEASIIASMKTALAS